MNEQQLKLFESAQVRSHWSEEEEKWYFSVVDVVEVLTGTARPRKYWSDLKTSCVKKAVKCPKKSDS